MSIPRFSRAIPATIACLIVLGAFAGPAAGQTDTSAKPPGERPRVGLVLSGGGARGAAHVGVLKILDELRVPVDVIVGTSMGAVVGGLYASGMSAADIESLMASVNWQDAFRDRPPREDLNFRRKQDDQNFLVRYALGIRSDGFVLPKGLIQGQKLEQTLRRATLPVAEIRDFDRLPVPFRAVATDLETGQAVILESGDLATAMRASMSAPGVFAPTEVDGRLLVDGGLVLNLPVQVARALDVDVVIAVDVSFPLQDRTGLDSPLAITNQMVAIMIRSRTLEQRALLRAGDVVIDPALEAMSAAAFERLPAAMRAGERAAREAIPALSALAVDPVTYERYLASRAPRASAAPIIDFVRVGPQSTAYAPLVDATLGDLAGQPLDSRLVDRRLSSLYALDIFESIDYRLVEQGGGSGLEVRLRGKSWGPNYVRFGLNLEDDFEGNSRYNAAARFIMTELNALGAEWLTDLQIGNNPRIFSEFYQPLTRERRYFLAPRIDFEIRNLAVLEDGQRIGEIRVRSLEAGLDVGREISNWGELRVGVRRGDGSASVRVGNPDLPVEDFDRGGFFFRFSYDKLDSVYFPRHGQQFGVEWRAERRGMGADQNFDAIESSWLVARSRGRNTLLFWAEAGSTLDDLETPQDFFTLGGFLNLSGLTPGALSGPHYGIMRFLYYRKIGRGGEGVLDLPAYAGLSLEAGNTWADRSDASFGSLQHDASLFLGLDTLLGPVYLATGFHEGGETAFYLFLGRTF